MAVFAKRGKMQKSYTKPIISVNLSCAEGIYAASGANALDAVYYGVWDRWNTNGGKGLVMVSWGSLEGLVRLQMTFNDTLDDVSTNDASVQVAISGNMAILTFSASATNPLTVGVHLDHGTSIDDLVMTGFSYELN